MLLAVRVRARARPAGAASGRSGAGRAGRGRAALTGRGDLAEAVDLAAGALLSGRGGGAELLPHLLEDLAGFVEDGVCPPLQVGGVLRQVVLAVHVVEQLAEHAEYDPDQYAHHGWPPSLSRLAWNSRSGRKRARHQPAFGCPVDGARATLTASMPGRSEVLLYRLLALAVGLLVVACGPASGGGRPTPLPTVAPRTAAP